jgi:hypothetical protein
VLSVSHNQSKAGEFTMINYITEIQG